MSDLNESGIKPDETGSDVNEVAAPRNYSSNPLEATTSPILNRPVRKSVGATADAAANAVNFCRVVLPTENSDGAGTRQDGSNLFRKIRKIPN